MRQGLQAVTGPRSLAVAAVVVLAAATVADAWAARGGRSGGWSGSHSSGASSGGQRSHGGGGSHGGGARSWAPSHHHGGVRSRVIIGAPFAAWPYSYSYGPPPPYYAPSYYSSSYPADYSGASGSFYYIERLDDPQRPPGTYFCPESGQYYPQVTECSLGWLTVLPTPSVAPE